MNSSFLKAGVIVFSCVAFLCTSTPLEAARKKKKPVKKEESAKKETLTFSSFMQSVTPAIVAIEVVKEETWGTYFHCCKDNFLAFCGWPKNEAVTPSSYKFSGFFFRGDGYIATYAQHLKNVQEITVTLKDGQTLNAKVVGTNFGADIAVLKVEGDSFPYLPLPNNSSNLKMFDRIFALGSSVLTTNARSAGNIASIATEGSEIRDLKGLHATNLPVNLLTCGGPLVSIVGNDIRVVGISTFVEATDDGRRSGYALPLEVVKPAIDRLVNQNRLAK